jgi:anti-anti-sigma regulatory factor
MTLKILTETTQDATTIRLVGRMQQEHLEELRAQMKSSGPRLILDLDQLDLVDVDSVRFLGGCKASGVELLHCSRYIEEWIAKEWDRKGEGFCEFEP